jgi:ATP-binding protein involved in chromosome partitioning
MNTTDTPNDTVAHVRTALQSVIDPDLGRDLVSLGMIKDIIVDDGIARFTVVLTTPACPLKDFLEGQCRDAAMSVPGITDVKILMTSKVVSKRPMGGAILPEVKHVIAIASGKGGVGKSTVCANLAIALAQAGAAVGVMDADVYGPTIPMLMGVEDEVLEQTTYAGPDGNPIKKLLPVHRHGVSIVSMGFLIEPGQPVVWRGPMLGKVVNQFLGDVAWGPLDYLLVDLPPGTGDVTMSLCEAIPLTGAVIVTTPQDVAASIAVKSLRAFQRFNVPILGIVENMAYFVAPDTGKHYQIFGHGGGQSAAEELKVPFLGELPLDMPMRRAGDEGDPILTTHPESEQSIYLKEIAGKLARQISIESRKFRPLNVV